MIKIELKRDGHRYFSKKYKNTPFNTLVEFLTRDIYLGSLVAFKKWEQGKIDLMGTNTHSLYQEDGNVYIEDDCFSGDTEFMISMKQFIRVLERWDELLKQQPKEIHIYEKNGDIILEGKD